MEEKGKGLTKTIARFIVETRETDIPSDIYEHAKVAFLDWLGVTIAGKDDPIVNKLLRYSDLLGGNEQATIIGRGVKKSLSHACLINGAASHALDYDDTMLSFFGHPSVTMFPSLLALSEFKDKNGSDFLTAYLVGFKVGTLLGTCAGTEHYMTGWHATSTLGHFLSASVCSRILGLNEGRTIYALGIAGTLASGLRKSFGTMCKPFHAGKAAHDGLLAVLLASDDFTSAPDIFEGPNGFFQIFKGHIDDKMVASLGKTWDIEGLAQKYHASCYVTHSPIEAAIAVVQEEGIDIHDIRSIDVRVSLQAPSAADKTDPKTGLEGKFSINYCVANALLRGNTGMQAFTDEKVNDPEVQDLMKKIKILPEKDCVLVMAKVDIETNTGKVYSHISDVNKEVPRLDVKKAKIIDKFKDLCEPVMGDGKTADVIDAILSLEKMGTMKTLIELLGK